MRNNFGSVLMVISFLGAAPLSAQVVDAGAVKLRLFGRVQTQFSTTSVDEAELIAGGRNPTLPIPSTMFESRRIRFGAELEFEKWLTGKLETEFGMARLQVRDAFLQMNFDPRMQMRIGQFKKPFSLMQLTSSLVWPVIERGVRIRGLPDALAFQDSAAGGARALQTFRGLPVVGEEQELVEVFGYQNFDLGASVMGKLGRLSYHAGVFNGTGSDRADDSNGKSYAARLTYALSTKTPVVFGGAVSYRETRVPLRPTIETLDGTAFEADIEIGAFRKKGLHLLGEFVVGDNLADDGEQFVAAQAVGAWFVPLAHERFEGLEFAGRVSRGDPRGDVDDDEALFLTPGINLYFFGRNRLMLNYELFITSDRFDNAHAIRAQAQLSF